MSGFALLFRLIGASLRAQAQYPASAIMLTVGHFLMTAIEIVAIWALFDRFGAVRGWGFGEVAVFYGLAHIMFSLADVATRGFDMLGTELVRTGDFDRMLLRPRAVTLLLVAYDFRLSRFGRFAQGLIVLLVGAQAAGVDWSLGSAALTLWAVAGGVALFCGIMIVQGAVSFWTVESLEVANVLTYGGVQATQFPLDLYERWLRRFLTYAVPLACVAYFPVVTLLDRPDPLGAPSWLGYVSPAAGFAFLALSFVAWRAGVRHYCSTGS